MNSANISFFYEDEERRVVMAFIDHVLQVLPFMRRVGDHCFLWYNCECTRSNLECCHNRIRHGNPGLLGNFTVMCPTDEMVDVARSIGLRAIPGNHNAFINERTFDIHVGCEKEYDAILNAGAAPVKRHALAKKIENLAMITYGDRDSDYYRDVIGKMHPRYINDEWVGSREVADMINKSRVGLALSLVEGANYATGEYLLCGLPNVSVKCRGGREFWYDDYNCLLLDENPTEDEVKEAVDGMISEGRDPNIIRSNFMKKADRCRREMADALNEVMCDDMLPFGWLDYVNAHVHAEKRQCGYNNADALIRLIRPGEK